LRQGKQAVSGEQRQRDLQDNPQQQIPRWMLVASARNDNIE